MHLYSLPKDTVLQGIDHRSMYHTEQIVCMPHKPQCSNLKETKTNFNNAYALKNSKQISGFVNQWAMIQEACDIDKRSRTAWVKKWN